MNTRRFLTAMTIAALLIPPAWSQQSQARPQFEVASIKPNPGCENRGGNFSPSPGRLEMPCVTLESLIQTSYGTFGDGITIDTQPLHMEGGPSWIKSEHYSLDAKSDGPARTEMLAGPMLQSLLEERFQLKIHRELRETPVFVLTVAKGGLKTQRLPDGACTPLDLTHPPAPPKPGDPPANICGVLMMRPTGQGGMMLEIRGATMVQFAQRLSGRVDRTVVDRTEMPGRFNFHLEFVPDAGLSPGAPDPASPSASTSPSLFVALQEQIGLKLSPDKGPVSILIVDHADRPTGN